MNQGTKIPGAGRTIVACLLAVLLAFFAPIMVVSELLSLMMVISVPSICTMALYRWAGKGPAVLSGLLQLVFTAQMLGGSFMWMALFTSVLPLLLLICSESKPFFTQMKTAIAAFCGGVVAAVAVLYSTYGGNMIERVMSLLPQAVRTIPADMLQMPMQTLTTALGRELTPESFYKVFDEMIAGLIPHYQMNLPGLLFSGAIVTAVLCTALGGYMRRRDDSARAGCYVPLRRWYLPASTTCGTLTMLAAAYIIYALGMQQGQTLYYTVYRIALTVFCIQAFASISRRLGRGAMRTGAQKAMLIGFAVLSLMGGALYLAIYGCASAVFGSRGALRPFIESKTKQ